MASQQEETKSNVSSEVSNNEPTGDANVQNGSDITDELLEKIKNQVQFYFSDVNLQRDKFLADQRKIDDGWIPMEVMLKFKLLASMSTDVDTILKALEGSDLIEISEDRKKIRRSLNHPLPVFDEAYRKAQEAKTVYLKGFPLQDTTIEKLKLFFSKFEPFENIVMRKYISKEKIYQFKGSVFVQFKSLEDAQAFMEREKVLYEGTELVRKWSADYSKEKEEEIAARRKLKSGGTVKENKPENKELPKGTLLHLTNISEKSTRESIKECVERLEVNIAFLDFSKGCAEGYIRLQEENTAKILYDKLTNGKLSCDGSDIEFRVLEGEEEEKYLTKTLEKMSATKQKANQRGRRKQNRGAVQRGFKRSNRNGSSDEPNKKKQAIE